MAITDKVKRIKRLEHSAQERQDRLSIPEGMTGFYTSLDSNEELLNHLYPLPNIE